MSFVRTMFKSQGTIYPEALCSTTASVARNIEVTGPVSIICTTGTMWVNATTTASTNNGLKLWDGVGHDRLDINILKSLSLAADTTTAKYQIMTWNY